MSITRKITVQGDKKLLEDVRIMLCFTPPRTDLFRTVFPVVWKVAKLAKFAGTSMHATYTDDLVVYGESGEGTANMLVSPGQKLTLMSSEGTLGWTPPEYIGGNEIPARNGTASPVTISTGFITDNETPNEVRHKALVFENVGSQLDVNANFEPVLSMYIGLDLHEGDIVREKILRINPLWKDNLLNLQPKTTISVFKTPQGDFKARIIPDNATEGFNVSSFCRSDWDFGAPITYRATLTFASATMVESTIQSAVNKLLCDGYGIKTVTQCGERDARVELILPPKTSCQKAEEKLLSSMPTHQYPSAVAIKERSGEMMKYSSGNRTKWTNISPATMDWYFTDGSQVSVASKLEFEPEKLWEPVGKNTLLNGTADKDVAKEEAAAENGDGLLSPKAAPVRLNGNTRILRKKSTSDISNRGD